MAKNVKSDNALRDVNARIASDYDAVIYDPAGDPILDPARFLPLAALFGLNSAPAEVLDLACGAGGQLTVLAARAAGRIVGLDISTKATQLAKQRFETLGKSADIRCVDLLDVEAGDLGQFDLISCIGSLYVVPSRVREKMLNLIGRCLRPGGIVLLSHYAGLSSQVAVNLQRLVQAAVDPLGSYEQRIADGRTVVAQFVAMAREQGAPEVVIRRAEASAGLPDVVFYHELLGGHLETLHTLELHKSLGQYGIGFVGNIIPEPTLFLPTSDERALTVDGIDSMMGGYRYCMYGKWPGPSEALNLSAQGVAWSTSLRRQNETQYLAEHGQTATIPNQITQAVLATLADGPKPWGEALAKARSLVGADGVNEDALRADVAILWSAGLLSPSISNAHH